MATRGATKFHWQGPPVPVYYLAPSSPCGYCMSLVTYQIYRPPDLDTQTAHTHTHTHTHTQTDTDIYAVLSAQLLTLLPPLACIFAERPGSAPAALHSGYAASSSPAPARRVAQRVVPPLLSTTPSVHSRGKGGCLTTHINGQ